MNLKSTLIKCFSILMLISSITGSGSVRAAVICTPSFTNGCTGWNNMSIMLNTLNWTSTGTCTDNDFTGSSTTLYSGASYPMTVTNGAWCGCAVWIDFDNNQTFDTIENVFHTYVGGSPSYTYNFNIAIPSWVPAGSYRMRVIGAWGSDGYTTGSGNGWGPCGSFQYGNFDDFTIVIAGPVGIHNPAAVAQPALSVSPNPAASFVNVTMNYKAGDHANLLLTDITGKTIRNLPVTKEKEIIDISDLAKGIYMIHYSNGATQSTIKLVK